MSAKLDPAIFDAIEKARAQGAAICIYTPDDQGSAPVRTYFLTIGMLEEMEACSRRRRRKELAKHLGVPTVTKAHGLPAEDWWDVKSVCGEKWSASEADILWVARFLDLRRADRMLEATVAWVLSQLSEEGRGEDGPPGAVPASRAAQRWAADHRSPGVLLQPDARVDAGRHDADGADRAEGARAHERGVAAKGGGGKMTEETGETQEEPRVVVTLGHLKKWRACDLYDFREFLVREWQKPSPPAGAQTTWKEVFSD